MRTRFLLVVLVAAVIPMGLIGVWLTRSVVRAGEELLYSELVQSMDKVAGALAQRWVHRSGELALLANNEVAHRVLRGQPTTPIVAPDSLYLNELHAGLLLGIPSFEYRDATGALRWTSRAARVDTTGVRGQGVAMTGPVITVRLPVPGAPGLGSLGEMIASIALSGLIASDTSLRLPSDARLQIIQRDGERRALLPVFADDSLLEMSRYEVDGTTWLAVHRTLVDPAVDLYLAAPLNAYVQPFERAARTGGITLAAVSVLALLLSAYFTTRLTASLQRLAVAADAVAAGDLGHRVEEQHGNDEVGRVASAFNGMMDNLRRTLGELSQRQAFAAVGEYAATLSHEVRNGLTAIRVDLQRAQDKSPADASNVPLIARALENVRRLDGMVTRSLNRSRSGQTPKRRLDLRGVLSRVAQSADSSFLDRGATLARSEPTGVPHWVMGDVLALEQLFLNLLLNAAQSLDDGGSATITMDIAESDARIVVEDSGSGITPENLARVLDPFFSTRVEGTGLGLSIARQVAVAHGGGLRIESTAGTGTRVEVRLPLVAPPAERLREP